MKKPEVKHNTDALLVTKHENPGPMGLKGYQGGGRQSSWRARAHGQGTGSQPLATGSVQWGSASGKRRLVRLQPRTGPCPRTPRLCKVRAEGRRGWRPSLRRWSAAPRSGQVGEDQSSGLATCAPSSPFRPDASAGKGTPGGKRGAPPKFLLSFVPKWEEQLKRFLPLKQLGAGGGRDAR